MFDNPKKELERLEQQLLAASVSAKREEFDDLPEDLIDDDIYDEELASMLGMPRKANKTDREFSHRSAGFDEIPETYEEAYEMERDRYVPAPKKKSPVGMVLVAVLELAVAIGLILWWAQHLGWLE